MKLILILLKFTFVYFLKLFLNILRFITVNPAEKAAKESSTTQMTHMTPLNVSVTTTVITKIKSILDPFFVRFQSFCFRLSSSYFKQASSTISSYELILGGFHQGLMEPSNNLYLFRILCFFVKINFSKDAEVLVSKSLNFKHGEHVINSKTQTTVNATLKSNFSQNVSSIIENKAVSNSVNRVFSTNPAGHNSPALPNVKNTPSMENVFVNNKRNSFDYTTGDASTRINFSALQSLYDYLKMFDDESKLTDLDESTYPKKLIKIQRKERIPKNFKGGSLKKNGLSHIYKNQSTVEGLKRSFNTLKQVEYLLKNRALLEEKKIRVNELHLSNEVKKVMFSHFNTTGSYGPNSNLYTGDLYSKNRIVVSRRVHLSQNSTPIQNLSDLKNKVGFSNFNLSQDEEWENSADVPLGGWSTGHFFFINPFLVFGFVCYSFFELSVLIYFMSYFFGNPIDTFLFFMKYPSVYFYENLSFFPSANYFFSALTFWFVTIFVFSVHLFELVDEERFDPPKFSWLFSLIKDFIYMFLILWCGVFCTFELVTFLDLLFSRIIFLGVPGYPNLISILFILFYDVFYVLGSTGYFSFYLENFAHLDIKFPTFYFSDTSPLVQRYPLVQPYFFGNPYLDRPNLFLLLCDSLLNFFSGENQKTLFFSNEEKIVLHRELIQDIRKYNYMRKNLLELKFVGQLHSRGWNGFNFRLDLQTISSPILPGEQVVRFDWRLKNTHFNGMYSRLFSKIHFGYDSVHNNLYKQIKHFNGRKLSSRYGYLRYLRDVFEGEDVSEWDNFSSTKKRKLFKRLSHLPEGIRKSKKRYNTPVEFFFFNPVDSKFSMLMQENKRIYTKADRNFKYSHNFNSIWSIIPGNNMPRKYFRYRPFISVNKFLNLLNPRYSNDRAFLKKSNLVKMQNLPLGKYSLRNFFLNKPEIFFPTTFVDERETALKSKNFFKDWKNFKKISGVGHKTALNRKLSKSSITRSFLPFSLDDSKFVSDQKVKAGRSNDLALSSSDYLTERKRKKLKLKNAVYTHKKKSPIYSRRLKPENLDISAIPNFPFRVTKKYKFAAKIFQNFQPKYFIRPTASLTTFSKIDFFANSSFLNLFNSSLLIPMNNGSGMNYSLSVFFLGFGRFLSSVSPVKLFSFDYYYSKNHNFLFSLFDNYLKQNQFRTMLTSSSRFNHPLKGGFRHSLDFLYPMLSELRLKEKLLPIDFFYNANSSTNFAHLRLDPYESMRNSIKYKGPCYFLDSRIQNWLNFNNVIWNEYFHFFFNRSYKTEGNGLKFCLASYNPIQGPASYKLFIDSPTLETPRVGQYFYNYISWLQYKFKWLLNPTSTYKRFDSFRYNHQHSNKKFYFTSVLKFYQMNLFRWQQAAQISQWNQVQSRNFLIHLFFHKYKLLSEIKNFFDFKSQSHASYNSLNPLVLNEISNNPSMVDSFNKNFFAISTANIIDNNNVELSTKNFESQFYLPVFTPNDFRFFQYVTDLRRWKALQTSFIRDWKFEKYIHYLGPLLYKDDVSSLMGFFAPFEYRNQIIVSRLRNDALRLSVFFPKKVIDEQFVNPSKRLAFPPQRFRRGTRSKFLRNLSISKPMYYAYVINKPFISSSSNYSFFSKKGKKFVAGLYPTLQRFGFNPNFNLSDNNGINFTQDNNNFFNLDSKKKKFLKDKTFFFSKVYELQEIRDRISSSLTQNINHAPKIKKFRAILDQFGKPLDINVPTSLPRLRLLNSEQDTRVKFADALSKKTNFGASDSLNSSLSKRKKGALTVLPQLYPDIFMRFGGPKASSRRWHMGQSWLKFVVASQNVSVYPVSRTRSQTNAPGQVRFKGSSDSAVNLLRKSKGFSGRPFQNRYNMLPEIKKKYGYFNFGLSGIGRLPRLSRSFFHMLFFRNKLNDFKLLKTQFLKIYLTSLPLFHNSDFSTNASFKIFWSFFTNQTFSKYSAFNFRYNLLFSNFNQYRFNFVFSNFIHHSNLGTLISYVPPVNRNNSDFLILHDQYHIFKSYTKFKILSNLLKNDEQWFLVNDFFKSQGYTLKYQNVNHGFFSVFLLGSEYLFFFIKKFLNDMFISLSFKFFNYFFINYKILASKSTTYLTFFDFGNNNSTNFDQTAYSFNHFFSFENNSNYLLSYKNGLFNASSFDVSRLRLFQGTFRSNLHWYYYPVQYYFTLQHFISSSFLHFTLDLFSKSLGFQVKYSSLIFKMPQYIGFPNFLLDSNNFNTIDLKENSLILSNFQNFYEKLFKINHNSFSILLIDRSLNLTFLTDLFLYRNTDITNKKHFLTFNSFFFNKSSLSSFTNLNNKINILNKNNDYFVENLELFSENLFHHSNSIDGSGRHNRPKNSAQTLDKIFTYREYEKYRHEHHRQRFRGITPHWVQNTFKNRSNFRHFYKSPDKRKRIMTRILLNRMFQYVKRSRSRFSPKRLNRISFYNFLNDQKFFQGLSSKNRLDYSTNNNIRNSVNLVDTSGATNNVAINFNKSSLYHNKSMSPSKFIKSYSSIRSKRDSLFTALKFNVRAGNIPELSGLKREERYFKHKGLLKKHSHTNFFFAKNVKYNEQKVFDNRLTYPFWYGNKKKFNKYSRNKSSPLFFNSELLNKKYLSKVFHINNYANFNFLDRETPRNLRLQTPTGFYKNGGNFINTKNYSPSNQLFVSPRSYSLKVKGGSFFSGDQYVKDLAENRFDTKIDYPPARHSIKEAMIEPNYRTSPRYLRTLRGRKRIAHFLNSNTIGGLHSRRVRNPYMNPNLIASESIKRRRRKFKRKNSYKYPINIKRFIRPFSKVIMSIPYLYSKWFTQNPRLSTAVDNEMLRVFSNNNYDELNYIFVQSLLLLKRKIMFNVINIKLISYKHKILYFTTFNNAYDSEHNQKNSLYEEFYSSINIIGQYVKTIFKYLQSGDFFIYLYRLRHSISSFFFENEFFFVRLLHNPLVHRFRHDSSVSSDFSFFQDFYYQQTSKRLLAQISFSSHSLGGWNNPLGLDGQYSPGLNFYSKGSVGFNFNYQQDDLFSGRFFAPEILLDNNLIRQNKDSLDRNYFFNEFYLNPNYKKSWHFLAFRVSSPISPFMEYERPHFLIFQKNIKSKVLRMPLNSLRRVRDIYPNYLKSFFSTLSLDNTKSTTHDITLPLKMKLLNFHLKVNDAFYRRNLVNFFNKEQLMPEYVKKFSKTLRYKQFKVLSEFHNRMNLATLVNKRRFSLRKRIWSPFRYNFYYKFNWRTFLHKYSISDPIGFRQYKLSPFFDLSNGYIPKSLKIRALQHLIVSQIPRFEIDSRRRLPLNTSQKEFSLLFFSYFNYVGKNFSDTGYQEIGNKIFKYVNRKAYPFLTSYFIEGNRKHSSKFWNLYDTFFKGKSKNYIFKNTTTKSSLKLPKYNSIGTSLISQDLNKKESKKNVVFLKKNSLFSNYPIFSKKKKRHFFSTFIFKFNLKIKRTFSSFSNLVFKKSVKQKNRFFNYFFGDNFLKFTDKKSFMRKFIKVKFQNSLTYKNLFIKTTKLASQLSFYRILKEGFYNIPVFYRYYQREIQVMQTFKFFNIFRANFLFFRPHHFFYNYSSSIFQIMFDHLSTPAFPGRFPRTLLYHYAPSLFRHSRPALQDLKDFFRPYFLTSKIFGINTLFNLRKSRERSLNPQSWLSFDLFSRVRPSFRPFLHKFSKKFMFSRYLPSKGISSYNTFIKTHTPRDSYFERHPYISFSIGLGSNNSLISSESAYKEIRTRSNMLDFSRRHFKFLNPLNFSKDYTSFQKRRKNLLNGSSFHNQFTRKRIKKYKFFSDSLFKFRERDVLKKKKYRGSLFFLRKMAHHFLATKAKQFDINPTLRNFKNPSELNVGKLFLYHFKHFHDFRVFNQKKRILATMPLRHRFNGIFKNSSYFSVMPSPIRRRRFLNIFLYRPYNTLLKFIRFDNYVTRNFNFLANIFLTYGSLNHFNAGRLRSYYQPNLKVFFDFNAYKQRYNLGLLFRGLSFENDFQLFLFRRAKFTFTSQAYENLSNSLDFLNLSVYDSFNLLISKNNYLKGFSVDSKGTFLNLVFEKWILKINPFYLLLIFLDFYLGFFYSLYSMASQLHFFDFTFFANFFQTNNDSIYYLKKRPIFSVLFHIAFFSEYLKFSWLFSLKFLILNFEYYPYYFLCFSVLLLLRVVSFNVTRTNMNSPFIVPYNSRFTDFSLNPHSGWFDDAWSEIKSEALDKLNSLDASDTITLSHAKLLGFDEIKLLKRQYQLENQKRNFFQSEEENDDPKKRLDLTKYERVSRTDEMFQKPIASFDLKRRMSQLWLPNFFVPSITLKDSDKLKLLDIDSYTKFPDQFDRSILKLPQDISEVRDNEEYLNLKDRSNLSFFFLKKQVALLLSGKISFYKFLDDFNFGSTRFSRDKSKPSPHAVTNYNVDDFSEEFSRIFLSKNSELSFFANQDLKKKRMFSDDENIHFYRKPGSILNSELMARKHGTENDQLYYVVEFPGRFNNTHINSFSKLYAVRNLNYNSPYYGFFTFSKNAKLPTTFEEFLVFCSEENNKEGLGYGAHTQNPKDISLQPNIERMRQLWNIFQYVVKYEYNMFNEYDMQDNHFIDVLSKIGRNERSTMFDNFKFWFNKASVDAVDINYLNRRVFFNVLGVSRKEVTRYGKITRDSQDGDDDFSGVPNEHIQTTTPIGSFMYIFYIYLFFFLFFLFLTFFFCFMFLFFFSFYNYVLLFFY